MTWVAVAIAGAAAVGYLATSEAARKSANAIKGASRENKDTTLEMFYQNREDLAPWREAGKNALADVIAKINAGPGDFTKSPGYDFRLGEGTKAIERSAAAKGGLLSGGTSKALLRYGQDYATSEYDNFLRRYYESLNPLLSLADKGQIATNEIANLGTSAVNQLGQNNMLAANAQAGGFTNQANAFTGNLNSGLNNYLMWKYFQPSPGSNPMTPNPIQIEGRA